MSWVELCLKGKTEAVDWVCTLLAATTYTKDIYIDESRDTQDDWTFTICFYLANDVYASTRIQEINNLLSPLQRTGLASEIQAYVVAEKQANVDSSDFPVRIGKRFVILSPEATYQPQAEEISLRLKTSLAFGSGLHPATILAMRLLEKYVTPKMNSLDLGSGSGILSIAIAKLGGQVLALDSDGIAVESTQDAVERNAVAQQVKVMRGSLGKGGEMGHWMGGDIVGDITTIVPNGSFDLIAANIFGRIHTTLAPEYRQALRSGGMLVASGFNHEYEESVITALQQEGFELVEEERLGEWIALIFRNR
ncbi:50S ribosomal protein L11 methyltransferase [Calothrix sp. UHCC 0171]|uniref:50S ribosomal protein L11 methyltransferase n=1 Tax=Calothrix sp. UHCC 0171 TaxID=3110245 RepID=UPI002B21D108|nr:50S ribosomal protein L11 methyltransferase [Calothrix sp. UHCC 0171]MEA5572023.1 50S ribosomal protein L11 methyltransferase [Calothrix sp. UHCC 0171]